MSVAVLDFSGTTTTPGIIVPDGVSTQRCHNAVTRKRELYRHHYMAASKTTACIASDAYASCRAQLKELKAARISLSLGRQVKSVLTGSKQVTFNQNLEVQKACVEELIYEHECECGKYMKQKQQACMPAPCGCGDRCGCGNSVYGLSGYYRGHL